MGGLEFVLFMLMFHQYAFGEEVQDLANFNSDVLPGTNTCGLQTDGRRIFGGTETQRHEFPWLAALEYKYKNFPENDGVKCTGSVINKRYVLTAAHCLNLRRFDLFSVWLGVWNISEADSTDKDIIKKFNIEEKIPHEFYENTAKGYDIALIKLDEDIIFTDYIRPICLPKEDLALPSLGFQLAVAGWGTTESSISSDVKLKVTLPLAANAECGKYTTMCDIQMCAGGEDGKDSCIGDSGGPLMKTVIDQATGETHWYTQGIVSFGQGCGVKDSPGVYTRVSKFTDWILSKVK